MINVAGIIGRVVGEVQKSWDSEAVTPEKPYFMHGPYAVMVNTLIDKDAGRLTKFKKYPAIMLPQPFKIVETASGCEATMTIVIVALSKPDIKTEDRYDYTFNPTLYPIAELLRQELLLDKQVNELDIKFEYTEHPYWKSDGSANMANDYIDAIEITNLKINFLNNC